MLFCHAFFILPDGHVYFARVAQPAHGHHHGTVSHGTATKGNREGHREVAGATCNFPDFGEFAWNLFFKGVWGQSSLPIWLLGTIEFIWAGWIALKPYHKSFLHKTTFCRDHFLVPKGSPGQDVDPGVQNPILGSKICPWA